jgi:myo-inositol-1(or 4)-monophosphatase
MRPRLRSEEDLALALAAVREAADAVLARGATGEVRFKSADQPVTDADIEANAVLKRVLLGERPGYGWLSEETVDSEHRRSASRVWIVDPIDGTQSFLDGYPEFGISVALAVDGAAEIGVVHNPATGETYHAIRGGGAFRNGNPVRVGGARSPRTLLAARSDIRTGMFEPLRGAWRIRPLGSTVYKMVRVADGSADAYISAGFKHEWDVCAAALIAEEAGGTVTDLRGRSLRFNRADPAVQGILVTGGPWQEELLEFASELGLAVEEQREGAP